MQSALKCHGAQSTAAVILIATRVRFEPTRGDPIGLAGRRLSRSAKVSYAIVDKLFESFARSEAQAVRGTKTCFPFPVELCLFMKQGPPPSVDSITPFVAGVCRGSLFAELFAVSLTNSCLKGLGRSAQAAKNKAEILCIICWS